jgi:RHS repeat-associated protein
MPHYGYQGSFSEEVSEFELNYNEFELRTYDPQIGRWTTADPYDEFASPYLGMGTDPINNVDPDGGSVWGSILSFFGGGSAGAGCASTVGMSGFGYVGATTASTAATIVRYGMVSLSVGGAAATHFDNLSLRNQLSSLQNGFSGGQVDDAPVEDNKSPFQDDGEKLGKEVGQSTDNTLHWKLTGNTCLYIFTTDADSKVDYDYLAKNSGGWDYIIGNDLKAISEKLESYYGKKKAVIQNIAVRSHGASNQQKNSCGPNICGEIVYDFNNISTKNKKAFDLIKGYVKDDANVLFTACSIIQPWKDGLLKNFQDYWIKGTNRNLFLNRTKTGSRTPLTNGKETINFNSNLINADPGKSIWAGFTWSYYDPVTRSIKIKNNFYNIKVTTRTGTTSPGFSTSEMNIPAKWK